MARSFNGTSDEVVFGMDATTRDIFASGGTLLVWMFTDSDGENNLGRFLDSADSANTGYFCNVEGEVGGAVKISLSQRGSSDTGVWITDGADHTLSVWEPIVITYDASSVSNDPVFYINGSSSASSETQAPLGVLASPTGDLHVGDNYSSDVRAYDGNMGVVALYDRILTTNEISAIANGANPFFIPNIQWYSSLEGNNSPEDEYVIGATGTLTGTSKYAGNPPFELMENYL